MPLRAAVLTRALAGLGSGAEMRIHSSVRFGALASFHLVDDRQYRDPQACTRGGKSGSSTLDPATCAEWQDPKRSCSAPHRNAGSTTPSPTEAQSWNVLGLQTLFGQRDFRSGPGPDRSGTTAGTDILPRVPA